MEWTQERVEALFNNVEENQHLDYKDGKFLKNNCRDDLTKHIVGFANSDGGALIIGVAEGADNTRHYATAFAPCDGFEWSKERLESLIDGNISPRINGIVVHPIRLGGEVSKSIYVIEIPKSDTCHQASDLLYYYRLNFSTKAMHDFQIRDVMNRKRSILMKISIIKSGNTMNFILKNVGLITSKNWILHILIPYRISTLVVEKVVNSPYKLKYGVSDFNILFGNLNKSLVERLDDLKFHQIIQFRNRADQPHYMIPKSSATVAEVEFTSIDIENFSVYWMLDVDDGNRTHGIITSFGSDWEVDRNIDTDVPDFIDM